MINRLEIIRHIIEFHHTIRNELQRIGQSINDLEALFQLRSEYSSWSQSSIENLAESKTKLRETLKSLEEGLRKHFAYEEDNLPPILGEVMMKGLLVEHRAIRQEIKAADNLVFSTEYDSTGYEEAVLQKSRLQQAISNLAQSIENHASREETVLDMARKGLES